MKSGAAGAEDIWEGFGVESFDVDGTGADGSAACQFQYTEVQDSQRPKRSIAGSALALALPRATLAGKSMPPFPSSPPSSSSPLAAPGPMIPLRSASPTGGGGRAGRAMDLLTASPEPEPGLLVAPFEPGVLRFGGGSMPNRADL